MCVCGVDGTLQTTPNPTAVRSVYFGSKFGVYPGTAHATAWERRSNEVRTNNLVRTSNGSRVGGGVRSIFERSTAPYPMDVEGQGTSNGGDVSFFHYR